MDPEANSRRPIVWPAYLVAAVCFGVAVALSLINLSLIEQLKAAQALAAATQSHANGVVRALTNQRSMLEDLMDADARHIGFAGGDVVIVRDRLYLTLHDLAQPPRGKVYEAWTEAKSSSTFAPSTTFVPDAHGVALVALPVEAKDTAAVEITLEPEGGTKTPSGKVLVTQGLE